MRVIAGSRRSLPLKTLDGDTTRPTADKYKETLFNCLQLDVPGSVFLDLFAGSGAIGIEALSRGAARAVFVENARDAAAVIRDNIRFTRFEDQAELVRSDAISYLRGLGTIDFDLIYIDPPYSRGLERDALSVLAGKRFRDPDTKIIVEAKNGTDFSYLNDFGFRIYKEKRYKTNMHLFLKKTDEPRQDGVEKG